MRTSVMTALTAVALGLAAAGCGDGEPTTEPTAGTTATGAGPVAACVTGTWRTTEVSGEAGNATAGGSLSGGAGATLTIERDGAARADFTAMTPVTFTARVADVDVAGQFFYRGQVSGTIRTGAADGTATPGATATTSPAATATTSGVPTATTSAAPTSSATSSATAAPTSATGSPSPTASGGGTGAWEPVGQVDWGTLRLTVELTRPVAARPLDNAPIGDDLDDVARRTGEVVDVDPMLGAGRYRCDRDQLVLSPVDDRGTTWTLTRA